MAVDKTLRKGLFKVFMYSLLSLFLVPLLTYGFVGYVAKEQDASFLRTIEQRIANDQRLDAAGKREAMDFYRVHPISTLCGDDDPSAQRYRETACKRYGNNWHFYVAGQVAVGSIAGGIALLACIVVLSALAFVNRGVQYASFVAGWRLMTLGSAVMTVAQGAMCAWLSFWLPAYFMRSYSPKLVICVGLLAAGAAGLVVLRIFKRVVSHNEVEGEVLAQADAPLLWQRIRHLAARLRTAPPEHIVAGIDANFFVTEAPLTVGDRRLTGRTLFVSLPLLRFLDQTEADAVLSHELAHLGGGDTRNSAALGPKLQQYDQYLAQLGIAVNVYYPMTLYRMIFKLALARDSREREFRADLVAARLVSPQAIARSLVKIAAYAHYRHDVERRLFGQDTQHDGALGIASFVSKGLHPYAASEDFRKAMETAGVPHPFDTHPPMRERLRSVGHVFAEADYGGVVTQVPQATWAAEILTADAIEERLWSVYEQQFAQRHELSLAYRYEPASDEERAVVLKYFPPVVFDLRKGQAVEINYAGIVRTGKERVSWDEIKGTVYQEGHFGDALTITHFEKATIGHKTTKLKLGGIGKHKDAFQEALNHYWHRHQLMRQQQAQQAA